jgi:hypothetical protein
MMRLDDMTRWCVCILLSGVACLGQNYDESAVPKYTLPDPLVLQSGERVRDAKTWRERRRPEILELYRREVFGRSPDRLPGSRAEVVSTDRTALGGKAVRKIVAIRPGRGVRFDMLLYLPAGAGKPSPVFLGLGFQGNHSVSADPGVPLGEGATESSRGAAAEAWQLEKILARGYGLAVIAAGAIEGGAEPGVRSLTRPLAGTQPAPDAWGIISAWAWGLSRAMDYLETDPGVDASRVALVGHSRMGKAALWAGAQDERFSLVISNESGEGGAAITRRRFGERIANLNATFPQWFCGAFKKYDGREDDLPVDAHMLLALIAPRPVYVASAAEDLWADPRGEFLALVNASPVYEMLGKKGLGTSQMPGLNQPLMGDVAYHVRAGAHAITAYDWDQYLKFADIQWSGRPQPQPPPR